MDVIGLLQNKKRCLRRFLQASEDFLDEARAGDFSGLERMERRRMSALKTLELIDAKVTEAVRALSLDARTRELSQAVQQKLEEEAVVTGSILKTDRQIVELIEAEKLRLQKELGASRRTHELTGRFKSTWIAEAGEGLDQKI